MFNFTDTETLLFPDSNFEETIIISFDMQLKQFLTPTSSVMVSKEVISKFKFNESLRYKAREDVDCFLRCHEFLEKSIKIKGAMVAYRIRKGQISGSKIKMFFRHYYVMKNYRKLNGSMLGIAALWYTISHFIRALFLDFFEETLDLKLVLIYFWNILNRMIDLTALEVYLVSEQPSAAVVLVLVLDYGLLVESNFQMKRKIKLVVLTQEDSFVIPKNISLLQAIDGVEIVAIGQIESKGSIVNKKLLFLGVLDYGKH